MVAKNDLLLDQIKYVNCKMSCYLTVRRDFKRFTKLFCPPFHLNFSWITKNYYPSNVPAVGSFIILSIQNFTSWFTGVLIDLLPSKKGEHYTMICLHIILSFDPFSILFVCMDTFKKEGNWEFHH